MRIITVFIILGCCAVLTHSADEHRPKKKEKRNLQYSVSHHYSVPSYRLERRISNGQQHPPLYSQPQYYPGNSRLYRTDHGQDLTDSNHVSDPIDRGGSGDTIYIPHKPLIKYIEKPVYIKEPEPIIEIIIKESNITLPPLPTEAPAPPQKKKKEEVQVFYVKYKKNPNGYGKDAVIYDKPIPAISPNIPEEPEPEEEWKQPEPGLGYDSYANEVTEPPRPSTTLRTIIKPDSEIYHSPGNNVKVTFGKEGFDYDKRSSKPEDYPGPPGPPQEEQHSRARQLSSFSNVYFKRPTPNYYPASSNEFRSEVRPPQSYRPLNNFSPPSNQYNNRPPNREYNNRPPPPFFPQSKYPFQSPPYTKPSNAQQPSFSPSSKSSFPNFSHSISHPPPPQFQLQSRNKFSESSYQPQPNQFHTQPQFSDVPPPNQRKPVPYTPFESLRPSQPTFSQTLPAPHESHQSFNQPQPSQPTIHHQTSAPQLPQVKQHIQFRPETRLNIQPQLSSNRPAPSFSEVNNQFKTIEQPQQLQRNIQHQSQQNINQFSQQHQHHQPQHHQVQQSQRHQQVQSNDQTQHQEHLNNLRTAQNILPPGGELIQSLPKYEQHLIVDSSTGEESQALPLQSKEQQTYSTLTQQSQDNLNRLNEYNKAQNNYKAQQQYIQANSQNIISQQQAFNNQIYARQKLVQQTTPRISYSSTSRAYSSTTPTPPSTTKEPEKPSTTTKDPKILEAQLPDEVPEELREQLLSSGILNNADISILDYDKVGDIPLSALPPDQLANFYNAGGASQLATAGSEPAPQVAALTSRRYITSFQDQEMIAQESEVSEVAAKPSGENVEMKVVRYNPESEKGQKVQETYINEGAKQVDPVVLNDNTYNRYLPLKVNGTQFPIPDVAELQGKQISSVVVLAPISYDFSSKRQTREANPGNDIDFIKNEPLKELLANPTLDNYNKFLQHENTTAASKQSVVLLITGSNKNPAAEKEIFMYDIATKTVSKLSGELSSAFVEAAEANSSDESVPDTSNAATNIVENKIPYDSSNSTNDISDGRPIRNN